MALKKFLTKPTVGRGFGLSKSKLTKFKHCPMDFIDG